MNGRPTHHDNDMTLGNGMLIAGLNQGVEVDQLAHTMLEAHWQDDADLADRATLADLARAVGVEPEPLLDAALTPEVQATYEANTEPGFPRWMTNLMTCFADSAIRINAIPSALRANPMSPGG